MAWDFGVGNIELWQYYFFESGLAVFRLYFVLLIGFLLTLFGYLGPVSIRGLSGITSAFFIPCLILSNTLLVFSLDSMGIWLPILLLTAACKLSGMLLGYLLAKFFFWYKNSGDIKCVMAAMAFSASGSFEFLLIEALKTPSAFLVPSIQHQLTAESRGIYYATMNCIVSIIFEWTLGYYLLSPEKPVRDLSLIEDEEEQRSHAVRKIPIYVFLLVMVLGIVPFVKDYLTNSSSVFSQTILDSAANVSRATPIIIIVLAGGYLALTYQRYQSDNPLENVPTISCCQSLVVTFFKLFIFPLCGIPIMVFFYQIGFITDPVLVFLMLIQFVTPTSLTLTIICNILYHQGKNMSRLLIPQYIFSGVTMTFYLACIFYNL